LEAREKWWYKGTVHQLFVDFKEACDLVRREVLLFSLLFDFGIPMNLVSLITLC
jgi:hypothetical protein